MRITILFICLFTMTASGFSQDANKNEKADLNTILSYMEGSFSSEEQAQLDSAYFNIDLHMRRIWDDNMLGLWLYVEQAAASSKDKPYRQRIYLLRQISPSSFSSTIYKFPNPELYVGGHLSPEKFDDMTPEDLDELEGCELILEYSNNSFIGSTEKGKCLNSWGEATYATSEVEIYPDYMVSWDRGWNDADEHVWGAEKGGYKFVKIAK